ncbi:hypothetical protein ACNF49_31615 [Actinomadura sp. ATCC 39365]
MTSSRRGPDAAPSRSARSAGAVTASLSVVSWAAYSTATWPTLIGGSPLMLPTVSEPRALNQAVNTTPAAATITAPAMPASHVRTAFHPPASAGGTGAARLLRRALAMRMPFVGGLR